ncbi:MAG TPA: hypothetical protein PK082_05165, partial [Phycisphaerae bacterium]|nr:hypothetical protein [Phycisphaerae bacterium]
RTDVQEAYLVGAKAVEAAMQGVNGMMVTLERTGSGDKYGVSTGLVELEKVANGEKFVPKEFIGADGISVTDAFRAYAAPLLRGEAEIEIGPDGLPIYARLAKHRVARKTGKEYRI